MGFSAIHDFSVVNRREAVGLSVRGRIQSACDKERLLRGVARFAVDSDGRENVCVGLLLLGDLGEACIFGLKCDRGRSFGANE